MIASIVAIVSALAMWVSHWRHAQKIAKLAERIETWSVVHRADISEVADSLDVALSRLPKSRAKRTEAPEEQDAK